MRGDFSKLPFDPKKHFSSVRMQQGRVLLDSDWNEQVDIQEHLAGTTHADIIGQSGAPQGDAGFEISIDNADKNILWIGSGHYFINGVLADNEEKVSFDNQPDFPAAAPPQIEGDYLVYLDVWQRHISMFEDGDIREVALGGPDTTTRTKTVWQVRTLPSTPAPAITVGDPATLRTEIAGWRDLLDDKGGKLRARVQAGSGGDNLYTLAGEAGYRGLENQLYRVEIHKGYKRGGGSRQSGDITFKWSRDNGANTRRWEALQGDILTFASLPRDEANPFVKANDWIELTDSRRELNGEPGILVRVVSVSESRIIIDSSIFDPDSGNQNDPVNPDPEFRFLTASHPIIRRWDFIVELDEMKIESSDINSTWFTLGEDGIEVQFTGGASGETYVTGDYWLIPARTFGAAIEWPDDENGDPTSLYPHGVLHHYSELALVKRAGAEFVGVRDLRRIFPELTALKLRYVSGDGQEAMPGEPLPQPLAARVSIGDTPIANAIVRFDLSQPDGAGGELATAMGIQISAAGDITSLTIQTNADGLATCIWRLPPRNWPDSTPPESVPDALWATATLLDEADLELDHPLRFSASFSLAERVRYEPGGRGNNQDVQMQTVTQVRQALDQLDDIKVNKFGPDTMEGSLTIDNNLDVKGDLTVQGDVIVRAPQEEPGDVWLGDHDGDEIIIHGILRSRDTQSPLPPLERALEVDDAMHIKGPLNIGDVKSDHKYIEIKTTMQDNVLRFMSPAGDPLWEIRDDEGVLKINEGDDSDNRLTISMGGNVGIGTASPAEKLTVAGNQPRFLLEHTGLLQGVEGGAASFGIIMARDNQSTGPQAYINLAREGVSSDATDLPTTIRFATTAHGSDIPLERMTIDNAGRVGIGTGEPQEKLHVHDGTLRVDREIETERKHSLELRRYHENGFNGTALTVDIGMNSGLVNLVAGAVLDPSGNKHNYLGSRGASRILLHDGSLHFFVGGSADSANAGSVVQWKRSLSINESGNIGMGTLPDSGARLEVNGDVQVGKNLRVAGGAEIGGNFLQVNKYDPGDTPNENDAGLEVFRGSTKLPAQLVWDEGDDVWKITTNINESDEQGVEAQLTEIATIDRLPSGVARTIHQPGHGFKVGQAIYHDGMAYLLALSSQDSTTGLFLVSRINMNEHGIPDDEYFTLVQAGYVEGLAGLNAGQFYYVGDDPASPGALTDIEPLGISNPILYADTAGSGYVLPYRPSEALPRQWGSLRVFAADSEAPEGAIFVDQAGNVGIGTDTPTAPLTIKTISGADIFFTGGGEGFNADIHSEREFRVGTINSSPLRLLTDNKFRLTIAGNGNVGIGTTSPAAKLDVAGSIKSPMWNIFKVFDSNAGALPLTGSFKTGGGTLLVLVSGSGWADSTKQIGMQILVDGIRKGYAKSFTNEARSHKTFTTNELLVTGLNVGTHSITLESWNNTNTDHNDFFNVTILELPF